MVPDTFSSSDFSRFYLRDSSGNPVIEAIQYTGSRKADFIAANTQRGVTQQRGYTWHHLDYDANTGMGRMVLVQTDVHAAVGHSGGVAQYVNATGLKYDD